MSNLPSGGKKNWPKRIKLFTNIDIFRPIALDFVDIFFFFNWLLQSLSDLGLP
jgi:hypothetical protein